jgi:tRNA A37 N6-isopentenylltransferase MiaA
MGDRRRALIQFLAFNFPVAEYMTPKRTLASAMKQVKLDARHYSKRRWTWWRAQPNTHWLGGFGFEEKVIEEAALIAARLFNKD